MQFTVLIPARLASTRLPGKPLADLAGVPMIVRVAQRVLSGVATNVQVVVAADSPLIMQVCQEHGVNAILTRDDHPSGSDRLAEACDLLGLGDEAIVVNVQGDEPLIDPSLVASVAELLHATAQASMSTAAHTIQSVDEFTNPNVVKVVVDRSNLAPGGVMDLHRVFNHCPTLPRCATSAFMLTALVSCGSFQIWRQHPLNSAKH